MLYDQDTYCQWYLVKFFSQLELLSKIVAIEPQDAYCAFAVSFSYNITFAMRTIRAICQYVKRMDDFNQKLIISVFMKDDVPRNIERKP